MAGSSSLSLVTPTDGVPTTTSLIIAEGISAQHKNVLELIRKNLADFEEFGGVAFEMQVAGQSPNPTKIAVLNRDHAILLMTYMRNTPAVRTFKKDLIRAFTELERRLAAAQHRPSVQMRMAAALGVPETMRWSGIPGRLESGDT